MSSEAASASGTTWNPSAPRLGGVLVLAVTDPDLDAGVPEVQGGAPPQVPAAEHGHHVPRRALLGVRRRPGTP